MYSKNPDSSIVTTINAHQCHLRTTTATSTSYANCLFLIVLIGAGFDFAVIDNFAWGWIVLPESSGAYMYGAMVWQPCLPVRACLWSSRNFSVGLQTLKTGLSHLFSQTSRNAHLNYSHIMWHAHGRMLHLSHERQSPVTALVTMALDQLDFKDKLKAESHSSPSWWLKLSTELTSWRCRKRVKSWTVRGDRRDLLLPPIQNFWSRRRFPRAFLPFWELSSRHISQFIAS